MSYQVRAQSTRSTQWEVMSEKPVELLVRLNRYPALLG
jgi:hypothetical protein